MLSNKRQDIDYHTMMYKCNCSCGCGNMMDSWWFTEYFGICKACVYNSIEHREALDKHTRSSYTPQT